MVSSMVIFGNNFAATSSSYGYIFFRRINSRFYHFFFTCLRCYWAFGPCLGHGRVETLKGLSYTENFCPPGPLESEPNSRGSHRNLLRHRVGIYLRRIRPIHFPHLPFL